ncbi:MAG: hypothetical protein FMNOHCHN_00856 [Ignavibacteriaceae bacterium]|nr:hypothetical protein [Ignavibacteriaceae bacterium]
MTLNSKKYSGTSYLNFCRISLFIAVLFSLMSVQSLAQTKEDCLTCHSDDTMTMEKKGKEISLFADEKKINSSVHGKLECVACHTGFDPDEVPHKENIQPVNCISCHKNAPVKHLFHPFMVKSGGKGTGKAYDCKGCHGTHEVQRVKKAGASGDLSCVKCHAEQDAEFKHSAHYRSIEKGVKAFNDCQSCHATPITLSSMNGDTLATKRAEEKLCLSCHLDAPEVRSQFSTSQAFIKAYDNSVHGKALMKGNAKAAGCVDCHGAHDINKGTDPTSPVAKKNIPETCGKCHGDILKEFNESSHGLAVAKGNVDAPVCTDCHGEHNILDTKDPKAPVAFQNVSAQVCAPCHNSVKLSDKYGISANRFATFQDTYHGLALEGGSASVANCASCHGVHNIKSSSDPTSTIHKSNLVATCGSCHPGANENFTVGKIHVTLEKEEEPILYYIAFGYILMIVGTIGGMFFHNIIDFIKKSKIKKMKQRGLIPHEKHSHALYLRMSKNERIQHITLAVSFILLVITGFMLRFPNAWWVVSIRNISENAFELRSLIHRIAAVVMTLVSLYHIYYILFVPRGKQLIRDLLPRLQDAKDAIGVFKYNLGLQKDKPLLDRFSYVEKAEYWALIWGTIVMTVTGVIMWFDNTFMNLFTKLGWDIARTIHYYEAWLAFLAIVVWHFYFVMFNPDVYPMSLAWWKGTITEEEMAEEHPLELQRIKDKLKEKEFGEDDIIDPEENNEDNKQ